MLVKIAFVRYYYYLHFTLQCTRVCLSCGTNIIPSHIRESNALLFAVHIAFRTNHLHIYATPHFRCRELIRIHRRVHVLHVHIYYTTGVHNARALRSFCILSHFPPKMQITAGGEQHPRQHPPCPCSSTSGQCRK